MATPRKDLSTSEIDQIKTMAGLGLKVNQMAAILGMSKATFERRMNDTPGASEALEKGRAQAAAHVTRTAYELATTGRHPVMTMFWLKCRQGWKEKSALEITGRDGEPLSFVSLVAKYGDDEDAKYVEAEPTPKPNLVGED